MIKIISTGFLLLLILKANCQINIADSTTHVISYWDKNEKQTYKISNEKLQIQGEDTLSRETFKYEVDITILDSSENAYLINWFYRDYMIETDNEVMKKLSSIMKDINVQVKTDELGTFVEVVNWEDIRDYILKSTSILKDELKDLPNIDKVLVQYENMYNSKQSIEATAINEILQFHFFHGLKYKLGEVNTFNHKIENLFGGDPFDATLNFWLDEIDSKDNSAVYKMSQSVDSVQLKNEAIKYLIKMAEIMKTPAPKSEDVSFLTNLTLITSRIHSSGWPIYSVQTKKIKADNVLQIEECKIELK